MKRRAAAAAMLILCVFFCSCSQPADTASSAEAVSQKPPAEEAASEPTPEPAADLTLNADGVLDGMVYRYNNTWTETSDPLTNATLRTYEINPGREGTLELRLAAVNDETTSAAVEALRTQTDDDREAVIASMIAAKDGTLRDPKSERAATPPAGTRAMWAYEGKTEDGQSVHGYSYVGGSQLYEISVTSPDDETYAAFETAWKDLINQLKFPEIEPVTTPTPEPTPEPTPQPTPKPTQKPVDPSSVTTVEEAMQVISSRFSLYVGKVVFHDVEYNAENNYYYYHLSVAAWHPDGDYAYDNGEPGDFYGYLDADTGYIAVGDTSLEEWAAYYA